MADMADDQEKSISEKAGARRFRLPEFFTKGAEAAAEASLQENLPAAEAGGSRPPDSPETSAPAPAEMAGMNEEHLALEIGAIRGGLESIGDMVTAINEREGALEKVFDALHAELADYKNDFLYEHLKPVVRPLLFLFDSMEQFDAEVAMTEVATGQERRQSISPAVVRENVRYFRDQLIEALRVCEVVVMEPPRGAFNAKFHKAIDVVPVAQEQDGTIQRVVRSGWFLNGQLLRPAEVVVGRFRG